MPMREILDWGCLIQQETREHKPEHWYLAQVALYLHHILHELRQMWNPKPVAAPELKVSDLLIGYKGPDEEAETREIGNTEDLHDTWKEKAKFSKSVWLGFAGLNREGKPSRQAIIPPHVVCPPPRSAPTPDQLPDPEFAAQMAALAAKKQDAEE